MLSKAWKLGVAAIAFVFPSRIAVIALRLMGCPVHGSARIGFSLVWADTLAMGPNTRIGHFNVLDCRKIVMRTDSAIRSFNYVRGPLCLRMGKEAFIGRRNHIVRARRPVSAGPAALWMGELAQITGGHRFDCMRSVRIGSNSTFAGSGSQVWTHGYVHEPSGRGRIRIDGRVTVGSNVSIGSGCIVSLGVSIADSINVGSHSSIAKDLVEPGLYVSQALRFISKTAHDYERELARDASVTVERVYKKGGASQ